MLSVDRPGDKQVGPACPVPAAGFVRPRAGRGG